jgi:RNA polymerase sigma factor (sigma-70 family)
VDRVDLIPHLFRTEYRKIVSTLCKRFGFDHIEIAEDIASDTFLTASQTWGIGGVPENPVAWLYAVAKNKAKNHLQRRSTFDHDVAPELRRALPLSCDIDLSEQNIFDSQLQMMFAICHPSIPGESQIGLALRILCGFGIEEIANAFLTNKETINKRLFRAKEKLREQRIAIEFPAPSEMDERLAPVLRTIYLLFSEGYYSISQHPTLREDLCFEAMRLCSMLVDYSPTNKPEVNALLALMCFHASRFNARLSGNGEMVLYEDQDPSLWDQRLINKGGYYLNCAATRTTVSKYHLEAAIAYWSTQKEDSAEKWQNILQLYDRLLQVEYSPVAALNRMYALAKVHGKETAIAATEKLALNDDQFFFTLLGELYTGIDREKAKENLSKALSLAKTPADKSIIQRRLERL